MMTREEFADEARFAKVVKTEAGDALLIAGMVFHVCGPLEDAAGQIASVLRGSARGETAGSTMQSAATHSSQ
jgi:hypothetical protein